VLSKKGKGRKCKNFGTNGWGEGEGPYQETQKNANPTRRRKDHACDKKGNGKTIRERNTKGKK